MKTIKILIITVFSLLLFSNCSSKKKLPESYEPFTYHSKMGGCGFFYRDLKDMTYVRTLSPDPWSQNEVKVDFPKCSRWGVCIFVDAINDLIPQLIENKVPEVMVVPVFHLKDKDLMAFSRLEHLNRLILTLYPNINDSSLFYIEKIQNLSSLYIPSDNHITKNGFANYQKKRPDVQIFVTKLDTTVKIKNFGELVVIGASGKDAQLQKN